MTNYNSLNLIIDKPGKLSVDLFYGAFNLIRERSPVDQNGLEARLRGAELIAIDLDNTSVVTTATLKNPLASYKTRIFKLADADANEEQFDRELGYIATDVSYEGRKLCQRLLTNFFKTIGGQNMFATTRDPAMMHILKKFGFQTLGSKYKEDLVLMVYKKSN